MKIFLNIKKITCSPRSSHQSNYVTHFKEKAKIFNSHPLHKKSLTESFIFCAMSFFVEQCVAINNLSKFLPIFLKRTKNFISSISFSDNDVAKIIRDLEPNIAYSHDMINIHMLKISGESISRSLEKIFQSYIEKNQFLDEWKKQMWFQFIKNDN